MDQFQTTMEYGFKAIHDERLLIINHLLTIEDDQQLT